MEWVCVALIIASMVYSGGIVVEYTNYNLEIVPQVREIERKTAEWKSAALVEIDEKERVKIEIARIRDNLGDLQLEVDQVKLRRQAEQLRKKRLDMILLKSSIRSNRKARMNFVREK
ncbi:MAG: hypothetical protein HOE48_17875 [Candidatus Latescibacteria bacterium]|jgi:hypothetical protein|nr:hypothetical protein [Candidatus Latescibacterota bacterium]MBT4139793.1 hypothetical protein [Candidatus Latescibacterota bacterium]